MHRIKQGGNTYNFIKEKRIIFKLKKQKLDYQDLECGSEEFFKSF